MDRTFYVPVSRCAYAAPLPRVLSVTPGGVQGAARGRGPRGRRAAWLGGCPAGIRPSSPLFWSRSGLRLQPRAGPARRLRPRPQSLQGSQAPRPSCGPGHHRGGTLVSRFPPDSKVLSFLNGPWSQVLVLGGEACFVRTAKRHLNNVALGRGEGGTPASLWWLYIGSEGQLQKKCPQVF